MNDLIADVATGDGALIADLTRRADAAAPLQPHELDIDTAIIARTTRTDERITTVNLEKWLPAPARTRGEAVLHDPSDFTIYAQRLATAGTTVWGEENRARFTAVFNDHQESDGDADGSAGWRDHTAVLQLQTDPDWQKFMDADGRYFGQLQFAEFLSDNAAAFVEPDGATLLEVATQFRAHKKAEFNSAVDLDTGDVQLTYNEETSPKTTRSGQVEVPKALVVQLTPFLGYPPARIRARLRYDIDGGQLRMGFVLQRPDLVKRAAFADIRNGIADGLTETHGVPVLLGAPPQPIAPQA